MQRYLIILGLLLIGGTGGFAVYHDVQQSREIRGIQQQLAAVQTVEADQQIDETELKAAQVLDNVYLTAVLPDRSVTYGTILQGQVNHDQLSVDTQIAMPGGQVMLAADIKADEIQHWQLADGSVTRAKIVNYAISSVKLTTGAVTEVKIRDGAVTGKKIARGQLTAVHLASNSVISAKVAKNAITEAKISKNAVTSTKIQADAITTEKIAARAVTTDDIAPGAVSAQVIADGSVTTAKLADGAVTTPKLADGAVTTAKLFDLGVTTGKIADAAITTAKITDLSITGGKLALGAVGTQQLADLAITAAKIATGTITGTQIASDGSVVKSIVGNSIVSVVNNNNGSYSIALTTSCAAGQILKYVSSAWQCDDDQGYFTPQDILRYPSFGTQKTDFYDNYSTAQHPTEPNYLLYLGAGKNGVVRHVFTVGMTPVFTNWTQINDYELRIYTGAGNIADTANPPSQYLDAQIPLGVLMGGVYDAARVKNISVETSIIDYMRADSNVTFTLNLPIPYQNGVLIQIWQKSPSQVFTGLGKYHWAAYEEGDTTFPYADWRLRASTATGTMNLNQTEKEFLNEPSGAGMLVGLYSSFKPINDSATMPDYLEANWSFYMDGSLTADWQTSGGEDIFGLNPFYFSAGEKGDQYSGTTYWDVDTSISEMYRIFTRDPIMWRNGVRGTYPNAVLDTNGSIAILETNILALYYSE